MQQATEVTRPPAAVSDVWSRTETKYRRRAFILLLINVGLFAGLGCVAFWLRTGIVFAPGRADYATHLTATFLPTLETEHTPTGLSLAPISIEQVPMMIAVHGLILAALVSIPILVAILYRFPACIPFLAVVGFVAVMPWLAIALLGSCILASVKPFKIGSRFASSLMGLLPVILYFFMASRQSSPPLDPLSDPADRVKLMAPLILAVVASAMVMGTVLIIARVVNYRPGAIAPLLAILFLTPAALFEFKVGRDELHYRLLERDFGPGAFDSGVREDVRDAFERAVERRMTAAEGAGEDYAQARARVEMLWGMQLDADLGLLFTAYQDRAARAADRFVKLFPDSIYACNALYLKGRALDMRVDLEALKGRLEITFYDDFPSLRSQEAWAKIVHNAASSPASAVARLRLARLNARAGRVDEALAQLRGVCAFDASGGGAEAAAASMGLMERRPPESHLGIPIKAIVSEARRLKYFLENNRDPLYGDAPVAMLMTFDPRDAAYVRNARSVTEKYPQCRLRDNIELIAAQHIAEPATRASALQAFLAQRRPSDDTTCEAGFSLAAAHQEAGDIPAAREQFMQVTTDCKSSVWSDSARVRIEQLGAGQPAG